MYSNRRLKRPTAVGERRTQNPLPSDVILHGFHASRWYTSSPRNGSSAVCFATTHDPEERRDAIRVALHVAGDSARYRERRVGEKARIGGVHPFTECVGLLVLSSG